MTAGNGRNWAAAGEELELDPFGDGKEIMDDDKNIPRASAVPSGGEDGEAPGLIDRARRGDPSSMNDLISMIYPELKRRAYWLMTRERLGHTFGQSGSELVQRVMEKILASGGHVFQAARTEEDLLNMLTRQMRDVLVDYARAHTGSLRANPTARVGFDDLLRSEPVHGVNVEDVLTVNEGLDKLVKLDPDASKAFEMHFFGGLTNEEGAAAMGWSVASYRRAKARADAFLMAVLASR